MSPRYIASMSCHIGAVKGWWELLHLPWAKKALSSSAWVNRGNSVIQRKWGSLVITKSPGRARRRIPLGWSVQKAENAHAPTTRLSQIRKMQTNFAKGSGATLYQLRSAEDFRRGKSEFTFGERDRLDSQISSPYFSLRAVFMCACASADRLFKDSSAGEESLNHVWALVWE